MKEIPRTADFSLYTKPGTLYVDKTEYLYKISRLDGVFYCSSRPTWFGLTFFMRSMVFMYRGERELFKGLYIDRTDHLWSTHPVLELNFMLACNHPDDFHRFLKYELKNEAEKFGIVLDETKGSQFFYRNAIKSLSQINKVVVIIDEFDKPLRVNATNGKLDGFLTAYRDFFSVLRESEKYLELCIVFGTTPLPRTLFSPVLDSFVDLTFSDEYSALFGYTQKELEENFAEYIENGMSLKKMEKGEYLAKMKTWFGGYRFSPNGEEVYHPGFISRFFGSEGENGKLFKDYWVMIGRIGHVIREKAESVDFDFALDREVRIKQSKLEEKNIVDLSSSLSTKEDFICLLYWYGYFTAKEASLIDGDYLLTLGYTNRAMEDNLESLVLEHFLSGVWLLSYNIFKLLNTSDTSGALTELINYIHSIPYKELKFSKETLWHSVFFYCLRHMGAEDTVIKNDCCGFSIEGVVECSKDVYIIRVEFNNCALSVADNAKKSHSVDDYRKGEKPLHIIGINFITDEIPNFEWKEILIE